MSNKPVLRRPVESAQYTSIAYTERVAQAGMRPSIKTVGDALDNAMAESWVASIKSELSQGQIFPNLERAEHRILEWIGEGSYARVYRAEGPDGLVALKLAKAEVNGARERLLQEEEAHVSASTRLFEQSKFFGGQRLAVIVAAGALPLGYRVE